MMWSAGGFGFLWMALWMALFWVGVILLVVWAVRQSSSREAEPRNSALDILEERFARGEVDTEEFEARRRDLVR
jgi:putative membrane protein